MDELAERGQPRGADAVFDAAEESDARVRHVTVRRWPVAVATLALAVAAAVLVATQRNADHVPTESDTPFEADGPLVESAPFSLLDKLPKGFEFESAEIRNKSNPGTPRPVRVYRTPGEDVTKVLWVTTAAIPTGQPELRPPVMRESSPGRFTGSGLLPCGSTIVQTKGMASSELDPLISAFECRNDSAALAIDAAAGAGLELVYEGMRPATTAILTPDWTVQNVNNRNERITVAGGKGTAAIESMALQASTIRLLGVRDGRRYTYLQLEGSVPPIVVVETASAWFWISGTSYQADDTAALARQVRNVDEAEFRRATTIGGELGAPGTSPPRFLNADYEGLLVGPWWLDDLRARAEHVELVGVAGPSYPSPGRVLRQDLPRGTKITSKTRITLTVGEPTAMLDGEIDLGFSGTHPNLGYWRVIGRIAPMPPNNGSQLTVKLLAERKATFQFSLPSTATPKLSSIGAPAAINIGVVSSDAVRVDLVDATRRTVLASVTPKAIDDPAFKAFKAWAIDRLGTPGSYTQAYDANGVLINEQPANNER